MGKKQNKQTGEKALERNLCTMRLRDFKSVKGDFLVATIMTSNLNVCILKLWNPVVCPVSPFLPSMTTPSPEGEGKGIHFSLDNPIAEMVVLYIKPRFYFNGAEGWTRKSQKNDIWFRR